MTARPGCRWLLLLLLCSSVLLPACRQPERREPPDVFPPRTLVTPAGGVYRELPAEIRLLTEAGATIYYHWEGEPERPYTGPLRPPASRTGHLILHYRARDASGNRETRRREHYVRHPEAAPVEIMALDRSVLGPKQTAVLQWRSTATTATYELSVTQTGWGAGRRLAQGEVVAGVVRQIRIPAAALYPGENRLWLRVRTDRGVTGATSRLLLLQATPATTRAWPAGGVFGTPQNVRLFTQRPATIYYTTDGSEPTLAAARYSAPLRLDHTTRLRYFSVDAVGNREPLREAYYRIQARTPSLSLQSISGFEAGGAAAVVFTWRSDTAGRYEVVLEHPRQQRVLTVQQGRVGRRQVVRNKIDRNFLSPGDWRVRIRVRPPQGQTGSLSFGLRVRYRETFADTRYRDPQATTAVWDTAHGRVRLGRGPRLLGTYRTRGHSRRITGRGPYAYLADSKGGLHIVDVSDPRRPRRAGRLYPHGKARALAKHRQYVYLAASASGVTVLDVSRPETPRLVAIVPLPGQATDIVIVAPYAYVGTQGGRLYILDLTMPLQPRLVGQVEVGGQVVDMAVTDDGMVYLACLDQGVSIVDARSPQQPRLLRRWPTSSSATGIVVRGSRAYVAAGALEVLDIRRPEAPVRQKSRWMQGAYGVMVFPPYTVVAAGTDGVVVVPMRDSQAMPRRRTAHYAARLARQGANVLVADTRGGLQIFDLSDPIRPRPLAGLDHIGTIVDVVVDGDLAYLANDRHGSGLVVVDISTPASPRLVGQYHNTATTDVVLWRHLALLGDAAGVLQVVDVQHPTQPRLIGSVSLPGKAQRLALLPPYVLVASDHAGIHVVDVRRPRAPERRVTVPISGRALDMALVGHTAYIAAVSGGIQWLDFSTPSRPTFGGAYHHTDNKGDRIIRLVADEQRLYAIDSERGLQILAPSPSGRLQLQGSLTVPRGAPWALTAVGPYVFMTTLLNSLYVIDATDPSEPRLLGMAPYGGAGVYASSARLYIAVRGRRGVPGGLRVVETFASVSRRTLQRLRTLGASSLPGHTPGTFLVNRAYTFTASGIVQSMPLSPPQVPVLAARLQVDDFWGVSGRIRYDLSHDGGAHWVPVEPGEWVHFAGSGTDLRWRATLLSTDLATTPMIEALSLTYTTAKPER